MVGGIRAVYHDGQLRLLDPVELAEGQHVTVTIQPEHGGDLTPTEVDVRLRAAGLLFDTSDITDAVELSPAERERIGALFVGARSVEELIDEDRAER